MRERIIAYFGILSLLGSGSLIVVLVYGAHWLGIEGIHHLKEAEIVRALETSADVERRSILTWLDARRNELAVVANSSDVIRATDQARPQRTAAGAGAQEAVDFLSQHLVTLKRTSPGTYDDLVLVTREKTVLAASDPGRIGSSYPFGAFIDAAFSAGAAERIGTAQANGGPVVLISRQVPAGNGVGKPSGAVAAVLVGQSKPRQSLASLPSMSGLGDSERRLILVSANGGLLASLPERQPGQDAGDPALARLSTRAASRGESWQLETLSDGRKLLAVYRSVPLGGTDGWGIAVAVDQRQAFAPLASTKTRAALFGLAMIAVALVFVGWGAGRFARPIKDLRSSVLALERGDFSARAATGKGVAHEISDLGAAFNSMAQRIENWHQELEHQVAERTRELRQEKEMAQRYLDLAGAMLVLIGNDGCISMINKPGAELLGVPERELIGMDWFDNFVPADQKAEVRDAFDGLRQGGQEPPEFYENRILTRGKGERLICWHNIVLLDDQGGVQGVLCSGEDITEKRKAELERRDLERQLLHTQKLESLGVLAGGIAHDFNNLLMAIGGNLELVRAVIEPGSPAVKYLENAHQASKRAGELTRQMLAYSGKGGYSVKRVDLNRLVGENVTLMKVSLPKGASLSAQLDPGLPIFEADPGQMQQVIVNLVTNAMEAVGEGGVIKVTTGVSEVGVAELALSRLEEKPRPGAFLVVQVADNGCGMDRATSERMFDPFFSTKFTGRGLGLSAVQGIVRGHGGAILVRTEPGEGTAVQVLLPVPAEAAPAEGTAAQQRTAGKGGTVEAEDAAKREGAAGSEKTEERAAVEEQPAVQEALTEAAVLDRGGLGETADNGWEENGRGTVLIVDDEEMVRLVCRAMVRGLGYRTMVASGGAEAVEIFREHAEEIAVVLMDLSMPGMDGMAAAERLRSIRPELRIVLSSGYSAIEDARRVSGHQGALFIQKPYDLESLKKVLGEDDIDP